MTLTRRPWKAKVKPLVTIHGSTIDPALRALVKARAGGRCECCAERLPAHYECHHRKLRSRGGQDSATNLVALCNECHRRIHGHVKWATGHGFIVSAYDDPMVVPVAIYGTDLRFLTVDGFYKNVEPAA